MACSGIYLVTAVYFTMVLYFTATELLVLVGNVVLSYGTRDAYCVLGVRYLSYLLWNKL